MSTKDSLPPIRKKKEKEDEDEPLQEKFIPKNWNFFKKSNQDLKKMSQAAKSRYLAYEDPPKAVADAQKESLKRLMDLRKNRERERSEHTEVDETEKYKHEKLIGQLKAAEARNRIRIMRLRYETNRAQEINHLISCQPTARKAVRLQALVPAKVEDRSQGDQLDKLQRARCEALLEDSTGLLTLRT